MSDEELKPCPFCGSKAVAFSYITEGAVRCGGCHAAITRGHKHTSETGYEEAIAAWNTRILAVLEPVAAPDPAAIREAALREAANLVNRIVDGERVTVPCPDGKKGCLVHHFRMEDGPTAKAILALIQKGAADEP